MAVFALIVASFFAGRLGQFVAMPVATATGFAPAMIDLGARAWGQVIPIELTFVNRGSEPLTVREVKSSCGCTVVSEGLPSGHVIEPGGSRRIAARLDTQLNPGPRQRTISLVAEGGRTYSAAISVQVIGAWSVSTDAVDFGEVVIDAPSEIAALERDIEFDSEEFDLLSAASSAAWLQCAPGERIREKRPILLRVQPTALRRGANSCVVTLVTNCDVKPNATVFVRVRAVHALMSAPERVLLTSATPREVRLYAPANRRVEIATARVNSAAVVAELLGTDRVLLRLVDERAVEAELAITDSAGSRCIVPVATFTR